MVKLNRKFCIAPMLDCSDRHSRYFLRLFSSNILLYTEMVTAAAINQALRDLAHAAGFDQQKAKELVEPTFDKANATLSRARPQWLDLADRLKFRECLPGELVLEMLRARYAAPEQVRAVLEMPMSVVHAQ